MSTDGEFETRLRQVVAGRSVRSLAQQTGWGRSTVHEWLSGVRLPSPSQLDDLLDAVGVEARARRELQDLRLVAPSVGVGTAEPPSGPAVAPSAGSNAVVPPSTGVTDRSGAGAALGTGTTATATATPTATPTAMPTDAPPAPENGGSPRRFDHPGAGSRVRRRVLIVLAALVAAVLVFGGGVLTGRSERFVPPGVPAQVAHTLGKGVFTRVGPSTKTALASSLFDGTEVRVVCLALNGSPQTDDVEHQTRTVWALLSSGVWVPDLYLNTPKNWAPPQSPPAPFRSC